MASLSPILMVIGQNPPRQNPPSEKSLGQNPPWTKSPLVKIPLGQNPPWTKSPMDKIPSIQNSLIQTPQSKLYRRQNPLRHFMINFSSLVCVCVCHQFESQCSLALSILMELCVFLGFLLSPSWLVLDRLIFCSSVLLLGSGWQIRFLDVVPSCLEMCCKWI